MFSIIIPLYNKSAHIEKAIQSVLNQSFHEFELIVVNDGSTDNSLHIVEHYLRTQEQRGNTSLSNHVRIINQENAGVSAARNNGVKAAKYDYIAFLDADDWWHKHYLSEMKSLIEQFPNAALYGSSYYQVKSGKHVKAPIGVEPDFKAGYINYCEVYVKTLCMPIWTSAAIITKKVFQEENGFKTTLKLGEDFDLWIRVALKHKIAFRNKPLAYYNHDVETSQRAIGKLHSPKTHILWNLDFLSNEERTNATLKQLLDNLRVYGLFEYFLSTEYREMARHELSKVDWTKQPKSTKWKYHTPVFLLKTQSQIMYFSSMAKQMFIKRLTSSN
jgi:glycosyltransferase involved in cell wall biosynthesis